MTYPDVVAMEAARRIINYDWVGLYPEKDAIFVAETFLATAAERDALRSRMVRDGAHCACHWTFKDEKDLDGTLEQECAFHMDIRRERDALREALKGMVAAYEQIPLDGSYNARFAAREHALAALQGAKS